VHLKNVFDRACVTARDCTRVAEIMKRLCLGIVVAIGLTIPAFGQQRQQVVFKAQAENSKYTQQFTIDVGDMPNHVVLVLRFATHSPIMHRSLMGLSSLSSGIAGSMTESTVAVRQRYTQCM
jgi:hypothetical protein